MWSAKESAQGAEPGASNEYDSCGGEPDQGLLFDRGIQLVPTVTSLHRRPRSAGLVAMSQRYGPDAGLQSVAVMEFRAT